MRRPAAPVAIALVAVLGLAACSSGGDDDQAGPAGLPLAGCDELTTPLAVEPPAPAEPAAAPLPELTVPCFADEQPFPLTELRGPAVVNLWATWCPPCIDELPVLQRFADRAAGQVHVVGVVTADRRGAAAALASDLELSFPSLYDRDQRLLAAVQRVGLPVTLFVDRDGGLRHVYQGQPYDDQRLAELVEEHLQVVPGGGAAGG